MSADTARTSAYATMLINGRDPTVAAMVDRSPTRAGRGIEHGVQKRPVGNRVAAVAHRLSLAVRRRNGAAIEMIASNDDRRRYLAFRDHAVDFERKRSALAIT